MKSTSSSDTTVKIGNQYTTRREYNDTKGLQSHTKINCREVKTVSTPSRVSTCNEEGGTPDVSTLLQQPIESQNCQPIISQNEFRVWRAQGTLGEVLIPPSIEQRVLSSLGRKRKQLDLPRVCPPGRDEFAATSTSNDQLIEKRLLFQCKCCAEIMETNR